jgi:hyperosmotically inducible protein
MKFKLAGVMAIAALTLSFWGCNQSVTDNTNANVNANANAASNTKAAAANQNANTNNNRQAPTRAEYDKNKESYGQEAKRLGRTIGTGLDDGWLWTKTRFDLAAAEDLRDSTINVDVANAIVTLTGTVANASQKAKAETIAKAVEGVKGVKNLLQVAANTNSNTANSNANQKKK